LTEIRSCISMLRRKGLHYLNYYLPEVRGDFLTVTLQVIFLLLIGFSSIMMIISEGGVLFSSMRLPLLYNLKLLAGAEQYAWIHTLKVN